MKKIGIVVRSFEENLKNFVGCRKEVLDAFQDYPVGLVLIPIDLSYEQVLYLTRLCDGVVLMGGDHFTQNDFLLVDYLYQQDIPVLGICLGMQVMALNFGEGREINVDPIHCQKNNDAHHIIIKSNTLLNSIVKKDRITVNSRHKTGVSQTQLCVSAKSSDGVIEAVEDKSKRFFLGVEWHPESSLNQYNSLIIDAFIQSLM